MDPRRRKWFSSSTLVYVDIYIYIIYTNIIIILLLTDFLLSTPNGGGLSTSQVYNLQGMLRVVGA